MTDSHTSTVLERMGGVSGLMYAAMGYPLLALALLVVYWAVRRANRRCVDDEANERMVGRTVEARS